MSRLALPIVLFAVLSAGMVRAEAGASAKASRAYKAGDYAAAKTALLPLAEAGDPAAQFQLGHMAVEGKGAEADPEAAAAWFRRAAEQGHALAQFNLAILHVKGRGVARDAGLAAQWLAKAAAKGVAAAQNNLGYLYATGEGVPADLVEAHKWFSLAASAGHPRARANREAVAAQLSEAEISAARKRARDWLAERRRANARKGEASDDKSE